MNVLAGKVLILTLTLFISTCLFSQSNTLIGWYSLNTKMHFAEKWSMYFEGQIRSRQLTHNFYYHDLKIGFLYNPSDKTGFHFGAGDLNTYGSSGNFKSPVHTELRLWEQVQLSSKLNIIKIEHRYRAEQRFFSSGYRNRYRYRLNTIVPITKSHLKYSSLFAVINEEVFLTNTNPFFEKNRWTAGLVYNTNKHFGVQISYAHDFDLRNDRTTSRKNYLQIALLFDIYPFIHAERKEPRQSID